MLVLPDWRLLPRAGLALGLAGAAWLAGCSSSVPSESGPGLTSSPGSSVSASGLQTPAPSGSGAAAETPPPPTPVPPSATALPTPTFPPTPEPNGDPSDTLALEQVGEITTGVTPKSVVATQTGLFFAQNMIYGHNIRVYNRDLELVGTISDRLRLSRFGYAGLTTAVRGGPVELAVTPDGRTAFTSNYSMYGEGFSHPGRDNCQPNEGIDDSFIYRIDVGTLHKTGALQVGAVPKFLAVSPDGRWLVVSNWCSGTINLVDLTTFSVTVTLDVGWHPRGIGFDRASTRAYVAVWDKSAIAVVDLATHAMRWIRVGPSPRHIVMDPAGQYLYVTLNNVGRVAKLDLTTEKVVGRVITGLEPRSMTIAADGRSLYVVNYSSDTVSKVRTSDMSVLQTIAVGHHPIGITYDNKTRQVWVAIYSGSLLVLRDT